MTYDRQQFVVNGKAMLWDTNSWFGGFINVTAIPTSTRVIAFPRWIPTQWTANHVSGAAISKFTKAPMASWRWANLKLAASASMLSRMTPANRAALISKVNQLNTKTSKILLPPNYRNLMEFQYAVQDAVKNKRSAADALLTAQARIRAK
jgi:hypothetical protein